MFVISEKSSKSIPFVVFPVNMETMEFRPSIPNFDGGDQETLLHYSPIYLGRGVDAHKYIIKNVHLSIRRSEPLPIDRYLGNKDF